MGISAQAAFKNWNQQWRAAAAICQHWNPLAPTDVQLTLLGSYRRLCSPTGQERTPITLSWTLTVILEAFFRPAFSDWLAPAEVVQQVISSISSKFVSLALSHFTRTISLFGGGSELKHLKLEPGSSLSLYTCVIQWALTKHQASIRAFEFRLMLDLAGAWLILSQAFKVKLITPPS